MGFSLKKRSYNVRENKKEKLKIWGKKRKN